ncbi:hypothetical protein C9374_011996 [Naegleria lovaniensis]|uniref:Uncharacterized protein n=1 Tax=Naegleria lovaniensis TaxID=51637 RepID=A0AA88KCS0_NAELO|nr:uncharacterized protein C9374_011996 [Naegleria lovaniensis]KAG2373533.1 hypothetical protein C9374_011996 [Naegleria lovaniensis]
MKRTSVNRMLQGLNSHSNTTSSIINSNHVFNSSSSMKANTIFLNSMMKHVPNNNKLLNYPNYPTTAAEAFGQIRSYTTTNWSNEKEASTNDSGGNTSTPSSCQPVRLKDYHWWNTQQVASVLASPKSLGGAGLSVDAVKPLYENNFDGSSLHNIIENIKLDGVKYAIDRLQSTYNKNNIPQLSDTCQSIVHWVNDKILPKPQKFLNKIHQAHLENATDFEKFYSEARNELASNHPDKVLKPEDFDDFEQNLFAKTTIRAYNSKFGYPNFGKQYRSIELPVTLIGASLAKHELPYFTQFQYTMAQDGELLKRVAPRSKRSAIMFMGPSGAGKTSACVRLLCHNPGMVLTCTLSNEVSSGLTTDSLMKQAFGHLNGRNIFELFGQVDQVVLMVFICRLIYILKLIDDAKQNPTVFENFVQRDRDGNILTGGILPYLAYKQSNGNTDTSFDALTYAEQYVYTSPDDLKAFVATLVNKIIHSLNDNSALFGIVKKIEKFIVVIDDAKLYASENLLHCTNLSELTSLNGEKRGLLARFAQVIASIEQFHLSIFSGTNFSVNVESIIQSTLGKTKAKIDTVKIYDFGLVSRDDIISFLEKHIKIPKNEKKEILFYFHEQGYKYFRRRLITLALEKFSTNNSLIDAIKSSVKDFVLGVEKLAHYLIYTSMNTQLINAQQGIQAIVKYVAHYHLPFLGSEFMVHKEVANELLYLGFSGPESSENDQTNVVFSAKDFIGYESGLAILKKILGIEDKSELMKKIIQERIKLLLKSSDHNINLESIVMLRLTELNGTQLSEIGCFKSLITTNPNLKDHVFKCKHYLDANGYVEYCISKRVIAPNKKKINGEMLFWTHFAEKKWDLLDGVFIALSNEHCVWC